MRLDEQHPLNRQVIVYLTADRKRPRFSAEPILAPDRHPDPYLEAGSHPDIVERIWDKIGAALPADCRALVYGSPALVHSETGIVLALAFGTQYAIRVPADTLEIALGKGCTNRQTWTGGGETRIQEVLGNDWLFGGWSDAESQWIARLYRELAKSG